MSVDASNTELIDFTPMYATHNAFRRDLARLREAAETGRMDTPGVRAGWANFKRQLDVHHSVEDAVLWPRLLDAVADRPDDLALIAEMEAEHARLDPLLAVVDEALAQRSSTLGEHVRELAEVLDDHMRHEEDAALPLIQRVLKPSDWAAFRSAMARRQGPSGAAVYIPWILDNVTPEERRAFLAAMPRPIGLLNRIVFQPRYRRKLQSW
ncbi:hemerythrin domain-containing protein [Nocardia sp. CDC160]|uniref:hemerythrin domain-containing protein n=1 Tax=Nocardia sp. CDC160 TaxID=3112166 RepID=UPI002DBDFA81|nr:hemerythrin domain-containing protein [Nocardia sp. CDC160]MEC3914494.1 hemerythrin domain-containing protein [Nocardia sp. CDC160]